MKFQKSLTPDKPFFAYLRHATHAPHHRAEGMIEKNKGCFDGAGTSCGKPLARQIALGVCRRVRSWPTNRKTSKIGIRCLPTSRSSSPARWEVYSAFGEYRDSEIGRLFDARRRRPV